MQQIFKYKLDPAYASTGQALMLQLANDNAILSVQRQQDDICLWALIDANMPEQERMFNVYPTGVTVPVGAVFLGTVQFANGSSILHVFDTTNVTR